MKYRDLSPSTQNYIKRITLYDGVLIFSSLLFAISTWGIGGFIFWIPFSLYTIFVGYICRQHAYCEDECFPYIGVWFLSVLVLVLLTKGSNALDKLIDKN